MTTGIIVKKHSQQCKKWEKQVQKQVWMERIYSKIVKQFMIQYCVDFRKQMLTCYYFRREKREI